MRPAMPRSRKKNQCAGSSPAARAAPKSGAPGVRGEAEKREIASAWLELALSCAKVSVKNDADELKAMEKQKQALGMEMG